MTNEPTGDGRNAEVVPGDVAEKYWPALDPFFGLRYDFKSADGRAWLVGESAGVYEVKPRPPTTIAVEMLAYGPARDLLAWIAQSELLGGETWDVLLCIPQDVLAESLKLWRQGVPADDIPDAGGWQEEDAPARPGAHPDAPARAHVTP